jgi:hypothetical protein
MRTGEVYSRFSGLGMPKDVIPWPGGLCQGIFAGDGSSRGEAAL